MTIVLLDTVELLQFAPPDPVLNIHHPRLAC